MPETVSALPPVSPSQRLLTRDFVLLWQGLCLNQVGFQTLLIALLLWFKSRTESATLVALVTAAATLPRLLLGPLGGALADRFPRRQLVIRTDLARALTALFLVVFLWLAPPVPMLLTAGTCFTLLVLGAAGAVYSPAAMALLPELVPARRLASANSLWQGTVQAATLAAQGLGGVLFASLGAPLAAALASLGYAGAALSAAGIDARHGAPQGSTGVGPSWLRDSGDGFGYVWGRGGVRALFLVVGAVNFFSGPLVALLPFYVERRLQLGPSWFGFLLAALSAGALAGYGLSGSLAPQGSARGVWRLAALLLTGPALALLSRAPDGPVALGAALAIGLLDGFVYVEAVTILQLTVAADMRGRVLALFRTVLDGAAPLAAMLAGLAVDRAVVDVADVFLACALATTAACVAAVVAAPLRACLRTT